MKFQIRYIGYLFLFVIIACTTTSNTTTPKTKQLSTNEILISETEKNKFYVYGTSFYSSIVDIYVYLNEEVYENDNTQTLAGGTGAFISSDGYIVTNQHVTVGGEFFEIWTYAEKDYEQGIYIDPSTGEEATPLFAELVGSSQCNDISLLKVKSETQFNHLEWYGDDFKPGLEIYTLGYPGVADGNIAVTTGVVSYLNSFGDTDWTSPGYETFAHTAPIFAGNSGGPVVSSDGKIVGISNMAGEPLGESFSLSNAINNDYVQYIIEEHLIKGKDYMDIGMGSIAIDMWWFLDEDDDRVFTSHFIEYLQPNGIADIGGLNENDLLIEVGSVNIGENEYSTIFCDQIKKWYDDTSLTLDYIAYSCSGSYFYTGEFHKEKIYISTNQIDSPYISSGFENSDFDLICDNFIEYYYNY